ncbi:hypothetical protein DNTS_017519 [Danionella cerebrum]|uniref:Metal transporter n=1 Tax=Danionella cerebrum TaxID=2873325 RepID=A0A553QPZ8_9TELE|nr:hypothetical protein DNTS_017519 [Danionella translucida]TRY92063.1 hypothetical protein DNTS_017519 [Danionella translucida]
MIRRPRLPRSNMVVCLAELRLPLIVSVLCGFGACDREESRVFGLRLEEDSGSLVYMRQGLIVAPRGTTFRLRLFGSNLTNESWPWVAFAAAPGVGLVDPCSFEDNRESAAFRIRGGFVSDGENSGTLEVLSEPAASGPLEDARYRLCVWNGRAWESVGSGELLARDLQLDAVPLWALLLLLVLLVLVCGVVRCLNLSLLWLDPLELYVLHSCGSEEEKRSAKRLKPIRRRGNILVCSLLFVLALGHSVLAVVLYQLFASILPAVFTSAFIIFLVAELVPHVVSSGYGFQMAPGLVWLAQVCLVLTCPLSCPLGLLLDVILRRDVSTCSIREKIMEMIRTSINDPYNEFVKVEFSKGALRTKTVEDILTPLKECFMLPSTAVLDFSTMSEIMQSGYTRVPIYEEEKSNIVEILYVKDLALVDPEDRTPMSTITKFYNHPLHFVFNDTKLDAMLEEFKKGNSHLAIVQKVNSEGEGDPFYEVLGLVTLEDVIEEIIKSEILDESDGYMEMKVKRPAATTMLDFPQEPRSIHDEFSIFKPPEGENKIRTSPQLLLATHRFLSREVEHFCPLRVSERVLFHLLRHPSVNQELKFDPANKLSAEHYLYTRNHPVDYFILLLQGRVEVEIGREGLKFENGAFTYYGVSALTAPSSGLRLVHHSPVSTHHQSPLDLCDVTHSHPVAGSPSSYCPDYSVRALTDLQLIKVTRLQYLNAVSASRVCEPPEIRILPNSQTKLLNQRNTTQGKNTVAEDLLESNGTVPKPVVGSVSIFLFLGCCVVRVVCSLVHVVFEYSALLLSFFDSIDTS